MIAAARADPDADGFGIGDRFERAFILAYSVGGIAFHTLAAVELVPEAGSIAPLWTATVAVLVLPLPLATLLVAAFAPLRGVRFVLMAHVALFSLALVSLVFAVVPGEASAETIWLTDALPVAMTAAAIAFPGKQVPVAIATLCLLLMAVRAFASGSVVIAVEEGVDMAMVGTVFAGLAHAVLRSGRSLEHATHTAVVQAALAAGRLGRRSERIRVGALVHDEILSFLLNVDRMSPSSDGSRAAARTALGHLAELRKTDPAGPTPSRAQLTPEEFVRAAGERVAAVAPDADVSARIESAGVVVPSVIADAFIDATVQAARNAVQHARTASGDAAAVTITIVLGDRSLAVEIRDDGSGFALASVPQNRMGLSTSILGRVRQLAGATAQIAVDAGTVVRLEWRR